MAIEMIYMKQKIVSWINNEKDLEVTIYDYLTSI